MPGRRSLGSTIALGFASLLVMLAGLIALAIREVGIAQAQRQELAAALEMAEAADRLSLNAARADVALRDFILSHAAPDLERVDAFRRLAGQALRELKQAEWGDPDSRQLAVQVAQAALAWDALAARAREYGTGVQPENALEFQRQYLDRTVSDLHDRVNLLRARLSDQVKALRDQLNHRGDRLTQALVLGFGLAGLVGVLLGVYFVRLVTEPVDRLVALADAVRAGDYAMVRRLVGQMAEGGTRASANEIELLTQTFAHMAETLEERERRLRSHAASLASANQVLTALQSLTDAALSELELDALLEQLLQRIVTGVNGHAGMIFLEEPSTHRLETRVTLNGTGESSAPEARADAESFAHSVAAVGSAVVVADVAAEPAWAHPFLTGRGVGAFFAIPLRLADQVVGVAHIESAEARRFEPTQVHLIRVFGERVERAIEHSRSMEAVAAWQKDLQRQLNQQQEQLLRSERLASIGLVGGSIAHELRNPLGVISNSVYFLRHRSTPFDEKVRRHLEIIALEVEHATKIINDLVDFSSGIEPMTTRLNLNTLLGTALESVRVPPEIEVSLDLGEGLPNVLGDESQLLQVFEHLIRNAVQAMENGGRLRISTSATDAQVRVEVEDTGPGVPREEQQRIFEPLVSTRIKGMGLGLTLSRRIVEAHGGEIRLVSEPGHGATFTVELPVTERQLAPVGESQPDSARSKMGE